MAITVKLINNVFDASRTLLAAGSTISVSDALAASLVGRGDAIDVNDVLTQAPYSGIDRNIVELTQAQINAPTAAILASTRITYQLNVAPRTRYRSDGTSLVSLGSGGGASAWGGISGAITDQADLNAALGAKAPAVSPTFTGPITHSGADQIAGTNVVGNAVDFNVGKNVQPTLTGATTVTFANAVTDRSTLWKVTGHATTAFVVTLPASVRSVGQQAVIASFTVPANWSGYIALTCTGAGTFDLAGEPIALGNKAIVGRFGTGANDTQVLTVYAPYAGTITNFVTQAASGTATYQLTINGTNVTGGANAVSSTLVNNAPSAANVVAVGDKIAIVRTADATCVNADFSVVIAPAKA